MSLNNNNTTTFTDGASLAETTGHGTVWLCPDTRKQFTRGNTSVFTSSRTGGAVYPSSGAIVQRARKNAAEDLNIDFSDLFLNDMIWATSVQAQSLLQKNRERLRATNDVLFDSLSRGVADGERGETSNMWFKRAIRYSAANDVELFGHIDDLYRWVGNDRNVS